jgi:Flp pilus assembly protein TadD
MRDLNHAAYVRGDKLFKSGQFVEAAKCFHEALDEWPDDWQAMWALGNCFSELGKHRRAEAQYRAALAWADPKSEPLIHFNLANALFDQHLYAEALAEYRKLPTGHHLSPRVEINVALAVARQQGRR